jgi:hypothetical protein
VFQLQKKKKKHFTRFYTDFLRLEDKNCYCLVQNGGGAGIFFCHKTCPDLENSVQVKIHKESKFCGRNEETNFGR